MYIQYPVHVTVHNIYIYIKHDKLLLDSDFKN